MGGRRTVRTPLRTLAYAGLLGVHVAGCGALLGVDHDWGLAAASDGGSVSTGDAAGDLALDGAAYDDATTDAPTVAIEDGASGASDDGGCGVGDLGCNAAQPQICAAGGIWHNVGAACSGTSPACLAGACVACTPTSLGCNGQQPQTCDSTGTWENTDAACSNQACVSGVCTGQCAPGASVCYYNYVLLCTATGTWGVTGVQC